MLASVLAYTMGDAQTALAQCDEAARLAPQYYESASRRMFYQRRFAPPQQ